MTLQEFLKIAGEKEIDIQSISASEALEAVKQDGAALQYVHTQTEAICLEAVKQNGYALQYVHTQTEAICLEAVKQNEYALQYVHKSIFQHTVTIELTAEQLKHINNTCDYNLKTNGEKNL